ncbi:MAG: 2OG-Fe(II) oxygenase [Phaeodactylibacter sp.]|nr:2OG-Fe(II) oxygenase [Phaeodactylibacter sp.]MCB9272519.1 2OG-Fe(II) oxygenase [Lewinellaceae bacterium]
MEVLVQSGEAVIAAIAEAVATNGYAVTDGFLPAAEVLKMQEEASALFRQGQFSRAGIGKGSDHRVNQEVRRDHIQWLDHTAPPEAFRSFFGKLAELIQHFNRSYYLGLRDMELHLAVYPEGAFYKRHLDAFKHHRARKLSVVFYLNTGWQSSDGGQLRLYLPQENGSEAALDVEPIAGRLACFNSHTIEHEVLPARRERYSLTGWLKDELALF